MDNRSDIIERGLKTFLITKNSKLKMSFTFCEPLLHKFLNNPLSDILIISQIFLVWYCILLSLCLKLIKSIPFQFPIKRRYINTKKIRMLFIVLSTTDNIRQRVNYETSLKKFIEMGHGAYFINKKGNFTYPMIEPQESLLHYQIVNGKFDPNRDRAIKRVSACKFYIENTTFDYLWITADDVFYDTNALDPMLDILSTKYDTNKDLVFLGHSPKTTCEKDIYYLQGGTGSILSRRGAKKFLEVG